MKITVANAPISYGAFELTVGIDPSVPDGEGVLKEVTAAGYAGEQPPYDAFWGARYAVVADPEGNSVGLMSPVDPAMRSAPPEL